MSTEMKPRSKHYFLTQFAGKTREDGQTCLSMQVTGASSFRASYFSMYQVDVPEFVKNLSETLSKLTDEEETVNLHGIELMQVSCRRLILDLNDWVEGKLIEAYY